MFSYSCCLKSSVECCWSRVLVSRGRFLVILQSWIRLHCRKKTSMGTISPDHGYGAQISHIRCGCPRASWYYPQFRGDLKILLSSFSNLPACFLPNLALCWWYQDPDKPKQLWLPKRKLDGHWKKIRRKWCLYTFARKYIPPIVHDRCQGKIAYRIALKTRPYSGEHSSTGMNAQRNTHAPIP